MSLEIFNLFGYSFFVWSAFFLTFASCFILFLKTRKDYLKQEKIFLDTLGQSIMIENKEEPAKGATEEILSTSSI